MSDSIISDLSMDKGEKHKVKNTAALSNSNKELCPIYDEFAHTYSEDRISKRVKNFPSFKAVSDDQKQFLIKKIKNKLRICNK